MGLQINKIKNFIINMKIYLAHLINFIINKEYNTLYKRIDNKSKNKTLNLKK